ncbi:MAG: phosphoribosylformylglycinamidine synthase subunit PurL [archaeon]
MHRIEVTIKGGLPDPMGDKIRRDLAEDLGIKLDSVRTIDVYSTDIELSSEELGEAVRTFSDPVVHECAVDAHLAKDFDFLLEVGFKPGVTDNVGRTAREAVADIVKREFEGSVYTSRQYLFRGSLTKQIVERIARDLVANSLIERWGVWHKGEWLPESGLDLPVVKMAHLPEIREIDLDVSDEELIEISRKSVLAMGIEEMKIFREYFKRKEVIARRKKAGLSDKPTDGELECFAQTHSEHCKHKIFNANINYTEGRKKERIQSLLKTCIRGSTESIRTRLGKKDFCKSVFKDNAGIIRFDDGWNLAFKVETHNAPSALDPYGGALTGIVGVNRDAIGTGMGSRLIFNTDVFCFGSPFADGTDVPEGVLHPKRVFKGVRRGVEDGGNQIGIPTVNGTVYFDDCFTARPLVYCGTGGIMPAKVRGKPSQDKKAKPGDKIVMVGGRIGKDGIHGATFSSVELDEASPATAVQIGAPIVQKRFQDMIIEARDMGLYSSITDNGAGGLNSSVGEMSEQSGGCTFDVSLAPLKYQGLQPWEILVSEAQERMTLAVPQEKVGEFLELCRKREVEAAVLGEFNDSGVYHVKYGEKTLVYLDMEFLHGGLAKMELEAEWKAPKFKEPKLQEKKDYTRDLKELLADLNICSKEWIVRQYDHEVQGMSVIKPLMGKDNDGPSDSAVLKPVPGSFRGIAVSNGINPQYGMIDTYHMAACCLDEAIRNIIASGGTLEKIAVLDNFCWPNPIYDKKGNPDGKYKTAQLVRANRALYDYTIEYGTPLISGKDSMSSDKTIAGKKYSIKPTLLVSGLGIVKDVRKAVSIDAKDEGDIVYVLGETKPELGGSAYYRKKGFVGNKVPRVDAKKAKRLYFALEKAMERGLVESCHDISDGGLAVALAESAFAGGLGMEVDIGNVKNAGTMAAFEALFSESQSRFVATVKPENKKEFESVLKGNVFAEIGLVKGMDFVVRSKGKAIVKAPIGGLKESWKGTLKW